jgi:hypothetical protein
MATSGVVTQEFDIRTITEEAYERAGYDIQNLNVNHARTARRSMNYTFAAWSNRNIRVFSIDQQTHTLASTGEVSFSLPAGTIAVLDVVLTRSSVDTPMVAISRSDYHSITDKSTQGRPDRYWIDRPTSGAVMYFWQAAENTTDVIDYWRIRRLYDVTAAQETPDVPRRWVDALTDDLAFRLFMKKPLKERTAKDYRMMLAAKDESFYFASTEDRDRAPTQVLPATWGTEGL